MVKKAGSLSLSKIESSGLRAASVGYEFVDGKTLSGKMSGADVDVLVPKSLLGQLKYLEGFEPAEDMRVEFNGWVKAWDGSEQSYQIIASKIKVPFSGRAVFWPWLGFGNVEGFRNPIETYCVVCLTIRLMESLKGYGKRLENQNMQEA